MIRAPAIAPMAGEQLGWGILLSFGLHVLLVVMFLVLPDIIAGGKRQIFAPVYNVNLVGAPRFAPAPPAPAAKPVAPPKPKPTPKEAIATKKDEKAKRLKRKKKQEAKAKKALDQRLKRLKSKVREDRRLADALNRAKRKASARQGAAVAGGSQGMSSQLSMRFQVYYTELRSKVYAKWVLPEAYVKNPRGLVAIVALRISKNGALDKAWLERSSGNRRLDSSALRAVRMAAPYPPLPSGLRASYHEVGIRFRPEDALR